VRQRNNGRSALAILALAASGVAGLHGTARTEDQPSPAKAFKMTFLAGYLPRPQLPDSLALLPPPPAPDSAAYAEDLAAARKAVALRGTPRWKVATQDADLSFPAAAGTFSCAIKAPITEKDTPVTYRLLRRSLTDAGLATYAAKNTYKRARPFLVDGAPICTPDERAALENDGSYPSGHTSAGWAWALILTEIAPDRADALLARGRAFGDSRMICNVHWRSDVEEGRFVGAATVARLHADPGFVADVAQAKAEIAAARAQGAAPVRDCAEESAALAEPMDLNR
jgi:acid phosphatase (class A)